MSSDHDAWPFLKCLREDGIHMYLDGERLFCRTDIDDPTLRDWITKHKPEIVAELKAKASRHETK